MAMLLLFALTLFASATLLFLVEPMVGKMILPLLGGTPAVWNTCMVFFQAILLAGYAYAHAATAWLGARKQAVLHLAVLLVPFLFFPLSVDRALLQGGEENPIPGLLLLLSVSVGMPMFVISTSAPLLQKWFASTSHPAARDPYFLYGASNLGSMIALVGYPVLVEPYFRLHEQTLDWSIGFGLLVGLTALCALFMWKSPRPAPEGAEAAKAGQRSGSAGEDDRKRSGKHADKVTTAAPPFGGGSDLDAGGPRPLGGAVTFGRRLRWVLLAVVPSSLMLGVTTYITTDIAAIPLLWVLPLGLYLLSFILVFARIPARVQGVVVAAAAAAACLGLAVYVWQLSGGTERLYLKTVLRIIAGVGVGGAGLSLWIYRFRSDNLLHHVMVLALPLFVLGLTFLMDYKRPPIAVNIALHLSLLFVAAMVCHGELARDRPDTGHLTEYFLWMSVGGVVGGLFNALVAPLAFNAIVEYPLAMVAACLLLPPLSKRTESSLGRAADVALAVMFVAVGGLLIGLSVHDDKLHFERLYRAPWGWEVAALLLGLALGLGALWRGRGNRSDRWLDLALPAALGVLVVGLSWGLYARAVRPRIDRVADLLHVDADNFRLILAGGLPAVLCYTFIERSLRFGLGVGALLLAAFFSDGVWDRSVFQKRSFFGVLAVSDRYTSYDTADIAKGDLSPTYLHKTLEYRSLFHGTTLHGTQFLDPDRRDEPLTYYHRTGPVGQVFAAYNTDPKKNYAVIGLGTGTMACYALPGQHVTFYDIDPVVRDISFREEEPLFTYVAEARKRGAHLDLVLGDARVQLERRHLAPEEKYSLMVIDAFSSDAIPIHLITLEALKLYLDRMTEDGIVCFHVSNRHLHLEPVLLNQARELGLAGMYENDDVENYPGKARSTWVVLARKPEYLSRLRDQKPWTRDQQREMQETMLPACGWPEGDVAAQAMLLYGVFEEFRPLAEWRTLAEWFKLTDNDMEALRKVKVPEAVLSKVEPLKGTLFTSREKFLEELAKVLTPDELSDYRSLLLKHGSMRGWPDSAKVGVWTDDYSNLLSVFMW
jgi:spermidine synthase